MKKFYLYNQLIFLIFLSITFGITDCRDKRRDSRCGSIPFKFRLAVHDYDTNEPIDFAKIRLVKRNFANGDIYAVYGITHIGNGEYLSEETFLFTTRELVFIVNAESYSEKDFGLSVSECNEKFTEYSFTIYLNKVKD